MRLSLKMFSLLCGFGLVVISGCAPATSSGLPDNITITMPDGSTQTVNLGTGPQVLANSTWACYQVGDNTTVLARLEFGPTGTVLRVFDTTFLPAEFGTEFTPDGSIHSLSYGLSYAAGSFGLSEGNAFTFEVPINGWLLGAQLATGTVYGSGTLATDRFDGRIGYSLELFQTSISQAGTSSGEYQVFAVREK